MGMLMSRKAGPAIVFSLGVAFLLVALSFHPTAQSQRNTAEFERLAQKAWRDGPVRVIVRLDVPRVAALTAASVNSPAFGAGPAGVAQREAADEQLRIAISATTRSVLEELQGMDYVVNREYASVPFVALSVSTDAIVALQSSSRVLGIEEDVPVGFDPGEIPTDTASSKPDPPTLQNTVNIVGASTAWSWGYTGQGWYVAILDTGIRKTHQFFTGKAVVEACFASGYLTSGDCPNGQRTQSGAGAASHHPSSYAGYGHGTHVSGIAVGNYGGLAGVAKGADIIAVQVFSKFPASYSSCAISVRQACVLAYTSDQVAGLDYVYSIRGTYRIAAVNMSLGGGGPYSAACDNQSQKSAIDNLRSAGIATAIATGNDGWCSGIASPGCISTAVAVGASTDGDARTSFSNWNPVLQKVFAPGQQVYSSVPTTDSSYESWDGTSMATPHVTGAWALLKHAVPNASVTEALNALRTTGPGITTTCDARTTAIPRIQVDRAIQALGKWTLTIQSTQYGTTSPAPGAYKFPDGALATVTALPADTSDFVGWSNAATDTANPVTVTMNADKTIQANFQFIYPPPSSARKVTNRSFSQVEYIDIVTWQPNPSNQGLNITRYRVYRVSGGTQTLLTEVSAISSSMEYTIRKAGLAATQYAIVAVTSNNREGAPAMVTVQ
jgi:subtilisin family serine protease